MAYKQFRPVEILSGDHGFTSALALDDGFDPVVEQPLNKFQRAQVTGHLCFVDQFGNLHRLGDSPKPEARSPKLLFEVYLPGMAKRMTGVRETLKNLHRWADETARRKKLIESALEMDWPNPIDCTWLPNESLVIHGRLGHRAWWLEIDQADRGQPVTKASVNAGLNLFESRLKPRPASYARKSAASRSNRDQSETAEETLSS